MTLIFILVIDFILIVNLYNFLLKIFYDLFHCFYFHNLWFFIEFFSIHILLIHIESSTFDFHSKTYHFPTLNINFIFLIFIFQHSYCLMFVLNRFIIIRLLLIQRDNFLVNFLKAQSTFLADSLIL